jgi:dolichol-phosphate mannosyltransferase
MRALLARMKPGGTLMKYLIVGSSGVAVNLVSFTLFMKLGIHKFIASPLAIETSVLSNFLLNHYWTFADRGTRDRIHVRGLKFNLVSFIALGISYSVFVVLSLLNPGGSPQIHQAVGIVPATAVNYLLNSAWTFKELKTDA